MSLTDAPAIRHGIPHEEYHADTRALSSSGARKLLPPSCPAIFHHERTNPSPSTDAMERGTAAHTLVLGTGPAIVEVDADSWRTKAAREEADEIRANGGIPLLPPDYERVHAMASALRAHPLANRLLDPDHGSPEVSLYWPDDETGVPLRCRLDWLPERTDRRMVVPDYKTARSADPAQIARSVATYGYHMQAAWNLDGVRATGWAEDPAFVLIVQETTAPYLVTVVEIATEALDIGRRLNRHAISIYDRCVRTGHWPGHAEGVVSVSLPMWGIYQAEEILS